MSAKEPLMLAVIPYKAENMTADSPRGECFSQGRNGSIKTTGIEVFLASHFPLKLTPINSRGVCGNCYIEVELSVLPELIRKLQEILAMERVYEARVKVTAQRKALRAQAKRGA